MITQANFRLIHKNRIVLRVDLKVIGIYFLALVFSSELCQCVGELCVCIALF